MQDLTVRVRLAPSGAVARLTRSHDVVGNFVEVVEGYAMHERATFEEVTQARSQAVAAESPEDRTRAENVLSGALARLMATAEAYPDLEAEERFQTVPTNLVAWIASFAPRAFLSAPASEHDVPDVELGLRSAV